MISHRVLLSAALILAPNAFAIAAERQLPKAISTAKLAGLTITQLTLEESADKMVLGADGMLYLLRGQGGRYKKGVLSKLNPDAFSRLLPKDVRGQKENYAQPDDLTEAYVFGRTVDEVTEYKQFPLSHGPDTMIAGADGKLYLSGHGDYCARFEPATNTVEWIKYGPSSKNQPKYGDPNSLHIVVARCFAASADGVLWCNESKLFHTRGNGIDLGVLAETKRWKYAALGDDGYIYGATENALVRIKLDGTDHAVLHEFTGKDDHPLGLPVISGNTLYGYVRDEKGGASWSKSGYLYKINRDGGGYSAFLPLDFSPQEPLVADANFLYGVAPYGLFRISLENLRAEVIAPAKEAKQAKAIAIRQDAIYVLSSSAIFRISLPK